MNKAGQQPPSDIVGQVRTACHVAKCPPTILAHKDLPRPQSTRSSEAFMISSERGLWFPVYFPLMRFLQASMLHMIFASMYSCGPTTQVLLRHDEKWYLVLWSGFLLQYRWWQSRSGASTPNCIFPEVLRTMYTFRAPYKFRKNVNKNWYWSHNTLWYCTALRSFACLNRHIVV